MTSGADPSGSGSQVRLECLVLRTAIVFPVIALIVLGLGR
jgi:hypothetical protein